MGVYFAILKFKFDASGKTKTNFYFGSKPD